MTLLFDRGTIAESDDFVKRVTMAMLQVAGEVNAEDRNGSWNDERRRLARTTFNSPSAYARPMAQRVATIDTFGSDPSPTGNDPANNTEAGDGALLYVVRSFWTDLARSTG